MEYNLVYNDFYANQEIFLMDSNQIEALGYCIPDGLLEYSDPEIIRYFPFTYGDTSDVDEFYSVYESGGLVITREGETSIKATAFGKLILPNTEINNVLLLKMDRNYSNSKSDGSVSNFDVTYFIFYSSGIHHEILVLTYLLVNDSPTPVYRGHMNQSSILSVDQNIINQSSIYPNPSNDIIKIDKGKYSAIDLIRIYDITGALILESNLADGAIDISFLKLGMYYIELNNGNDTEVLKFIKN